VFLFSSRLDDARRGGDIDLTVLATSLAPAERLALSSPATTPTRTDGG